MESIIILQFFLAIALGAVIGLEREFEFQRRKVKDFGGIRTFVLLAVFGALIGYVSNILMGYEILVTVGFISVIALIIAGYVVVSRKTGSIGATTEISAMISFLLGIFVMKGFITLSVIAAIVTAAVLAFKPQLHWFAKKIETEELYASLKFGIITLVVLPLLPNTAYALTDIPLLKDIINSFPQAASILSEIAVFNPFKIWLMVVFITGISYVGYILIKQIGADKGIGLTGFLGGLVSSTAVTSSLSLESKRVKKIVKPFVAGVMIASSTMFLRVLFEVLVINKSLLKYLIFPIGAMAITGFASVIFIYLSEKKQKKVKQKLDFETPFALMPAIKFGLFFAFVLFIAKLLQVLLGNSGLYLAGLLSGLADVDAITISMASLSMSGDISAKAAISTITIAVCSNTVVKGTMAYMFGGKEYGKWIVSIFGIILIIGLIVLLII